MEHKHTNSLIEETSPYLLQHAHNPVNWFAWGEEALKKAKQENKPILVSIGYSACHWCHVMEKESFEDEATATIMNEHFINIKIDREERPDLDHIYMEAIQAMTGSGGWPLNVFLTPELKPFYGGTYFPPVDAFNRMSWSKTLLSVSEAFTSRKDEIDEQAGNLMDYLKNSGTFSSKPSESFFSNQTTQAVALKLLQNADNEWGGFGRAPKFPQTFIITYLLQYYHFSGDEKALQQALFSLDKMMAGGIYDHVGGGFARYSTDAYWKVPHFEKMLYDNALLLSVYSEAFAITKDEKYKTVISETVNWLEREMLLPEGGFYSALDADSEGVEGKFYVWSKKEIENVLGENADWFCELFDVTDEGNWEESNILWIPGDAKDTMNNYGFAITEFEEKLADCKKLLLAERSKRIRPGLDDKILLSWNCLLISALCNCYAYTGEERYKYLAENNMQFIRQNLQKADGRFAHSYKNNASKQEAFLDDYATLAKACIDISAISGNNDLLQLAQSVTEIVIGNFSDEENTLFYFTPKHQMDIILRKAEVYDGATPSGNAVMAMVLYQLSVLMEMTGWKTRSLQMLEKLQGTITEYPLSFGYWAALLQKIIQGFKEIAIAGKGFLNILPSVLQLYIPERILQSGIGNEHEFPLLRNKADENNGETYIYLCFNYTCKQPVLNAESLQALAGNKF